MPFLFDFNEARGDVHEVDVSPNGWKCPLKIEYVVAQAHRYDTMASVVWRIKGTTHCFTIEEQQLNHLTHGDYKEHFTKALEGFRLDYLSWFRDDMYRDCDWKYEYRKQYGNIIIPEKDSDNKSKSQ